MAQLFYLRDALADGGPYLLLQNGGSAPAEATGASGWTVGAVAAGLYSRLEAQVERATIKFGATAQPSDGPDNALGDAFRTALPMTGDFAADTWVILVPVEAVDAGGQADGTVRVRIWTSPNADGSNATERTLATQQSTVALNIAVGAYTVCTLSFFLDGFTVSAEYLFVQMAWRIVGPADNPAADVFLHEGVDAVVIPSAFAPSITLAAPIASAEAWPAPIVTGSIVLGAPIASAEAWPAPTVAGPVTLGAPIASGEVWPAPALGLHVTPGPLVGAEAWFAPALGLRVAPAPLTSTEAWNVPVVAGPLLVPFLGSAEVWAPVLVQNYGALRVVGAQRGWTTGGSDLEVVGAGLDFTAHADDFARLDSTRWSSFGHATARRGLALDTGPAAGGAAGLRSTRAYAEVRCYASFQGVRVDHGAATDVVSVSLGLWYSPDHWLRVLWQHARTGPQLRLLGTAADGNVSLDLPLALRAPERLVVDAKPAALELGLLLVQGRAVALVNRAPVLTGTWTSGGGSGVVEIRAANDPATPSRVRARVAAFEVGPVLVVGDEPCTQYATRTRAGLRAVVPRGPEGSAPVRVSVASGSGLRTVAGSFTYVLDPRWPRYGTFRSVP